MRQSRDKPSRHQRPEIRGEGRTDVSGHDDGYQYQQDAFQWVFAGQDQHRGAYAYAQRVGRDQVSGFGDADVQVGRYVRQNPHHHEFGDPQRQGSESQRNKTLFHRQTFFRLQR